MATSDPHALQRGTEHAAEVVPGGPVARALVHRAGVELAVGGVASAHAGVQVEWVDGVRGPGGRLLRPPGLIETIPRTQVHGTWAEHRTQAETSREEAVMRTTAFVRRLVEAGVPQGIARGSVRMAPGTNEVVVSLALQHLELLLAHVAAPTKAPVRPDPVAPRVFRPRQPVAGAVPGGPACA